MDQFALIVKNYHRHLEKCSPTVKVAITDDGIDPLQANLQENIDGGTSFHHRPGRPDRPIYYWSAPGGYGTEMAKLICRICPKACLCIIHLGEGLGEKEARQIKPETAIEAIKWATTAGVHIISMSWSINQSKVSGDLYNDFQNFIRAVYDKGITMFCAASDHGNTSVSGVKTISPLPSAIHSNLVQPPSMVKTDQDWCTETGLLSPWGKPTVTGSGAPSSVFTAVTVR
ncbi:peptidase S8/S53 domain-containing protein [Aspergillus welwitschiae]|uniref:Peptidase S8/S53 domain-containing protein n=1 Tax=Aspergillus welwitschiae TaxID=1341132 RepID=A0A3F3PY77_9EURO|nr:peptidase S8/S53 domain-containing protein [Aspergillus welwitschiae]RDH31879.1 peptidase S8/S53 domain-containing protein [Aspergillus welwitschiae]